MSEQREWSPPPWMIAVGAVGFLWMSALTWMVFMACIDRTTGPRLYLASLNPMALAVFEIGPQLGLLLTTLGVALIGAWQAWLARKTAEITAAKNEVANREGAQGIKEIHGAVNSTAAALKVDADKREEMLKEANRLLAEALSREKTADAVQLARAGGIIESNLKATAAPPAKVPGAETPGPTGGSQTNLTAAAGVVAGKPETPKP